MSDAPEIDVSNSNSSGTEAANPITNGQPIISEPVDSKSQVIARSEIQHAESSSRVACKYPLPNVIQGVQPQLGQFDNRKGIQMISSSGSSQTNENLQVIQDQKFQEGRLSPNILPMNPPSSDSQIKPITESTNADAVSFGHQQQENNALSSNGPSISSVEPPFKPNTSVLPSSAPTNETPRPNASPNTSHPKSIPVSSYYATSNADPNEPRPMYSFSGSQPSNLVMSSTSSTVQQSPRSSSGPSQPPFISPFSRPSATSPPGPPVLPYSFPQSTPIPPSQSTSSSQPFTSPVTLAQNFGQYPTPIQTSQFPSSAQPSRLPPPPGQITQFPTSSPMNQFPQSGQVSQPPTFGTMSTFPPSSGQRFNPPMPQLPPPSSAGFSSAPTSFSGPPTSYPVPSRPSTNFPQPPMPPTSHHHLPPNMSSQGPPLGHFPTPSHMPRQQPPMPSGIPPQGPSPGSFPPPSQNQLMQPHPPIPTYLPRSGPSPVSSQPNSWAQANGIPNRQPQLDTINRQPVPSSVPMYNQGSTEMSTVGMQPPNMQGNMHKQMVNDSMRYPQQQQAGYQQYPSGTSVGNSNSMERMSSQFRGLSVTRDGFNKLWGADCYDLLQTRNILPAEKVEPPRIQLQQEYLDGVNCRSDIFRCTLTKIPETNSLLQKSRLPLGILIHPFKDVNNLPVVQCNTIVRCRACRTYINPFVYFVDHRRWKCNLCFRVNDMPEEFQFDPVTKTYGDPSRRPEIRSSTIEYIAPSEYMLRPPQAAVYLFLLDVSCGAIELGYLNAVCDVLSGELSQLPGDSRTQVGFIAFDSALHFFALAEGLTQPHHLVVSDTNEVFLPRPDNLLVNLQECKDLVQDLLAQLPSIFLNSHDTGSALGPALQAAYKLMAPTGGRVTVFQTCLPNVGSGALKVRGNDGSAKEAPAAHLNPATDFYKRLALDCSGQQVAVDLFILGSHYTDLATLSGVSQFSGGCIHHLPRFDGRNILETNILERCFHRYLSRKIGFEAVMRIRCSRGLSIHTFHGHFFVRSTDLLSLPNVNPDAGFGMQVAIDESLADLQNICFQAALLYTSSKGERRIRVHTLCLPIAANVNDVVCAADQQCIVGLLAKMAVDRSHQSSPSDARDAFINVATDVLSTYRLTQTAGPSSGLLAPHSLRLLPLYILALLKHAAFRSGQGTRLDDRIYAMCLMKSLPLSFLMQEIYPDLYPVHCLTEETSFKNTEGQIIPNPPRLHLSAEKLDSRGVFLLDRGNSILLYVGRSVSPQFCQDVFGVPHFAAIQDDMYELPVLESATSELLNNFVCHLQSEKPYEATVQIIREDSRHRMRFIEKLVEDRSESALSYYEFLQHLKAQIK